MYLNKDPWELTPDEFAEQLLCFGCSPLNKFGNCAVCGLTLLGGCQGTHRHYIVHALSRGYVVPDHVLDCYDLTVFDDAEAILKEFGVKKCQ